MGRYSELDVQKQMYGHTNFDNAHVIESYPYGRLRTQVRVWLEEKPKGKNKGEQRYMFQSLNPKKEGHWNNPRKGTYARVKVMYLDSIGHVQHAGISESCGFETFEDFVKTFKFTDEQTVNLHFCLKWAAVSAHRWGDKTTEYCQAEYDRLAGLIQYHD